MQFSRYLTLLVACFVCSPCFAQGSEELFESRIRPLLIEKCFVCHTQSRLGGLQLDSRANLLKGGNSGPAIVPGDSARSLLIQAVSHTHERLKMPPQEKLKEAEIAALTAWIQAGAPWPERKSNDLSEAHHKESIASQQRALWSLQPVRKPALPHVEIEVGPRFRLIILSCHVWKRRV